MFCFLFPLVAWSQLLCTASKARPRQSGARHDLGVSLQKGGRKDPKLDEPLALRPSQRLSFANGSVSPLLCRANIYARRGTERTGQNEKDITTEIFTMVLTTEIFTVGLTKEIFTMGLTQGLLASSLTTETSPFPFLSFRGSCFVTASPSGILHETQVALALSQSVSPCPEGFPEWSPSLTGTYIRRLKSEL